MTCFNPRTREGATADGVRSAASRVVSIYAPVRVRQIQAAPRVTPPGFQSTHPRGCDDLRPTRSKFPSSFNPRTREGATTILSRKEVFPMVSIHAPARVRQDHYIRGFAALGFQSTHPRGCDILIKYWGNQDTVSIHAPARVRQKARSHRPPHSLFQSTHPRGCDSQGGLP